MNETNGIEYRPLTQESQLPLLITPKERHPKDVSVLKHWIQSRHSWILEKLTEHGAMLFRGFEIQRPEDFEQIARVIDPHLKNTYMGTSPRNALTEYVFSASELPGFYPIPQHCEMSFIKNPPPRLFFCCLKPNSGIGGETPLADFRKVYHDIDPHIRNTFIEKGVKIIRNYTGMQKKKGLELWQLKRWDEIFQTTDRDKIQAMCDEYGFVPEWLPGENLRLISTQKAAIQHPKTGEDVWFNHAQVFHLSSAFSELKRIARRQKSLRCTALAHFAATMVFFKRLFKGPYDHPMHVTFEDGSEIPDRYMENVRDAIWKNMVFFKWETGDVVAIDNFAVSHGRMPYTGERLVAVCWA